MSAVPVAKRPRVSKPRSGAAGFLTKEGGYRLLADVEYEAALAYAFESQPQFGLYLLLLGETG